MYVSIVLNNEYMNISERDKWFLKNVSEARNSDCLIITHEYIKNNLDSIVNNCADRFYNEFEMEKVSIDKIKSMDICYVPDAVFENRFSCPHSRTQEILDLTNNRDEEFERVMIESIDSYLQAHNLEKPECILYCLHTFASVRYLAEYYDCPLVPYVFSAIRKVHGYAQTLYMSHVDHELFCSDASKEIYKSYNPSNFDFRIFNRKELLALLGKKHNLCLLSMLDIYGSNEMGIIGEGFHITPQTYQHDTVTDDDLYFESKKYYPMSKITSRLHPMQLDQAGVGRSHMKNDPAAWLLSTKRVITVQSQMIIKAALWNRATCRIGDSLPYGFLFSTDLTSTEPITEEDLNYIVFGYFVPNGLMFDKNYWLWRFTNPSANEIFEKHIKQIFKDVGLDESVLYSENRINLILKNRGCTDEEIEKYLEKRSDTKNVIYDYLSSKASAFEGNSKDRDLFVLNEFDETSVITTFDIENASADRIDLYLTNDIDGFVSIKKVFVDESEIVVDTSEKYWPKNSTNLSIELNHNSSVKIVWSVKGYANAFSS